MELKRYEQITSEEAIKRIINKEEVFDENNRRFYSLGKSNTVWMQTEKKHGVVTSSSEHSLEDLLDKKWYVKKPFDVRTEMLARPNEWVGAFKDINDRWHKVGFDTEFMKAVETPFASIINVKFDQASVGSSDYEELEKCIPIEDVPEEEWS